MDKDDKNLRTEWIFCRDRNGKCVGLAKETVVLEKKKKKIIVNGQEILGWEVKIVQEDHEGHFDMDYNRRSTE